MNKLREVEILLSQGETIAVVSKKIGVSAHTYFRWRKEYGGMRVDQAKRLKELEQKNSRLKKLVAELSLQVHVLKKRQRPSWNKEEVCKGEFPRESEILALVSDSGLPRRRALVQLGLPKSTYYRWLRQQTEGRLQDYKGGSSLPWNKLRS